MKHKYTKIYQILWALQWECYLKSQEAIEKLPSKMPPSDTAEYDTYMINWAKADTLEEVSIIIDKVMDTFFQKFDDLEQDAFEDLRDIYEAKVKNHKKREKAWLKRVLKR